MSNPIQNEAVVHLWHRMIQQAVSDYTELNQGVCAGKTWWNQQGFAGRYGTLMKLHEWFYSGSLEQGDYPENLLQVCAMFSEHPHELRNRILGQLPTLNGIRSKLSVQLQLPL
jgi:hypothetical protein